MPHGESSILEVAAFSVKLPEAETAISELWRAPGMNGSRDSNFLHIYGASGTDPIFRQIFSFEVVASGMAW
jgi:hypothetical protein